VHPSVVFVVPLESSLQGGGHRLCFHGIWTYGIKVIEFQSFYELKNDFDFDFDILHVATTQYIVVLGEKKASQSIKKI